MFVITPGQPVHDGSGAARVTNPPNLVGSLSMTCGAMPEMIVCFRLTCHQSSAKEVLLVGSNTTPSVLLVEVSGWSAVFPPSVIGNWVAQSVLFFTPPAPGFFH